MLSTVKGYQILWRNFVNIVFIMLSIYTCIHYTYTHMHDPYVHGIYTYISCYIVAILVERMLYIYIYGLTLWVMFRRNRTTLYAGYKMIAIITLIHPFTIRVIIINSNCKALQSEHKCLYIYICSTYDLELFFIYFASKLDGFVTREMRVVFHDTYMKIYS